MYRIILKFFCLLTLLFSTLFIISCESNADKVNNTGKYAPELNPHPKYFMTVKGYIDPRLQKNVQLKWVATYYTTNPKCEVVVNSLEGINKPREISIIFTLKFDEKGYYQYQIPLDRYFSGKCQWEIRKISYDTSYQSDNLISYFSHTNKKAKKITKNELICDKSGCKYVNGLNAFNNYMNIDSENNYTFLLNIRKRNRSVNYN